MNRFVLSSAVAALFVSSASFAGSTAELKVTGVITPGACEVLLSGANVDFGKIAMSDFTEGEDLRLGQKSVGLNVSCDGGPAQFWLKATDGAAASVAVPGTANYGLGMNGEKPIGYYTLSFAASENALHQYVLKSTDGGQGAAWGTPVTGASVPFEHDGEAFAFADSASATEPSAIKVFATRLLLDATLAKDPSVSQDVSIVGQTTIEIFY